MPTKKRSLGAEPSEFSKVFLRRLKELRRGRTHTEFAEFLGVKGPRYNGWKNEGAVPGADAIRQIAERCDVSADWLVGVPGATKSKTQAWDGAKLEEELSAEVSRRLNEEIEGVILHADGSKLLDRIVSDEVTALKAWEAWEDHREQLPALLHVAGKQANDTVFAEWLEAQGKQWVEQQPPPPPTRPPIATYKLRGYAPVVFVSSAKPVQSADEPTP